MIVKIIRSARKKIKNVRRKLIDMRESENDSENNKKWEK